MENLKPGVFTKLEYCDTCNKAGRPNSKEKCLVFNSGMKKYVRLNGQELLTLLEPITIGITPHLIYNRQCVDNFMVYSAICCFCDLRITNKKSNEYIFDFEKSPYRKVSIKNWLFLHASRLLK